MNRKLHLSVLLFTTLAVFVATMGLAPAGVARAAPNSDVLNTSSASPSRPTLSSPGNGSSWPQSTYITLVWNPAAGATQYKAELSGGPYNTMTPCNWQSGTSCYIGQMWVGTMFFRVKARDGSGQESDWSDTFSFTIGGDGSSGGGGGGSPSPTPIPLQPVQVVSVRSSVDGIEMGGRYWVTVTVRNPNSVELAGSVVLNEIGARPDLGDNSYGEQSQSVTLGPNATADRQFGPFAHRWAWLGKRLSEADCLSASSALKDLTVEKLPGIGNVIDLVGIVQDAFGSLPSNVILYEASARFPGGGSPSMRDGITVEAAGHKQIQLFAHWGLSLLWPTAMLTGVAAGGPFEPVGAVLMVVGALGYAGSCDALANASDPDSNYQAIAELEPVNLPSLDALANSPERQAAVDGLSVLSALRALNTSLARYEGAKEAGDATWMEAQLQAARRHTVNLLYALQALDQSLATTLAASGHADGQLSPAEIEKVRAYLEANGLPPLEQQSLAELGVAPSTIAALSGALAADLSTDPSWPTYIAPHERLIPNYQALRDSLNSALQNLAGPAIDIVAPTTAVSLSAVPGQNGWLVSDVTVTLTAADNPGGSGIKATEWSLDDGRTWMAYGGPFVLTQEGVFHLTARGIDNEDNIEYPPAETSFKVDKTPPVITLTTDQAQYTRVQLFIAHCTANDPQLGSGLASLACTFNGLEVSDGGLVDLFPLDLGPYTLTGTAQDVAGWHATQTASIEIVATIESLQATVTRLCQQNGIAQQSCQSLLQKLAAAQAARDHGQPLAAAQILEAFKMEVSAQTGKKVGSEASRLLLMDASHVVSQLKGG